MHVQRNPNFWRKPKHRRSESAALGPITGHAVHAHAVHIDGVGVQHLVGANVIETNEVRSAIGRGCALNRSSDEPLGFARCTKLHEEFRKDATSIFRRLDGGVRATCGISDTTQLYFRCGVSPETHRDDPIDCPVAACDRLCCLTRILSERRSGRCVAVEVGVETFVAAVGEQHNRARRPCRDIGAGLLNS